MDKAERVSFGSGSATLTSEARLILNEISRGICELPNPILVGGHTDRHLFPPGSVYTNWELSTDRANAARRELEAGCVKPELIRRIVGYADTQLLVPEDPYATANRRISITVLRLNNDAPKEGDNETSSNSAETSAAKNPASENRQSPASAKDAATHTDVNKPSAPAAAPRAETNVDSESRRAESQLATQGSISVGAPDAVPANATRTRERAPLRTSVLPQH